MLSPAAATADAAGVGSCLQIRISMVDGIELAATLYLPAGFDLAHAGSSYPGNLGARCVELHRGHLEIDRCSGVQQVTAMTRFELRWPDVDGSALTVTSEARLFMAMTPTCSTSGSNWTSARTALPWPPAAGHGRSAANWRDRPACITCRNYMIDRNCMITSGRGGRRGGVVGGPGAAISRPPRP
jgi:hypothetical protein